MTASARVAIGLVIALGGAACQLPRPDTVPTRMIEPRLVDVGNPVIDGPNARAVRLLETRARGHLGRRLLHEGVGGELTENPVWRWSSLPDRYLDSALRLAVAASPDVRLVDATSAPALGVTLIAWQLESGASQQLAGAVEVEVTGPDRAVYTEVIRATEPVSMELPGNLAEAAGRLLQHLASECLARATRR